MIAARGAIALAAMGLGGCSALLGPGSLVAENQMILQNFLLVTATVATTASAYEQTKILLAPAKENQPGPHPADTLAAPVGLSSGTALPNSAPATGQ